MMILIGKSQRMGTTIFYRRQELSPDMNKIKKDKEVNKYESIR